MKNRARLAALLAVGLFCVVVWPALVAGQSTAPPGPTGTGPRVDVQISPNGTLDVGGARGADLDMTGENFRGSFGASRSQGSGSSPALPAPGLPGSGRNMFGAPNFGPSLPGGLPGAGVSSADEDVLRTLDDETGVSGLILPRFRQGQSGNALAAVARAGAADSWRYQFFRGRWWYWQPAGSWLYWDGWQWQSYLPRK